MDFITILSIFVLACFVGYFVVWSVTPALHTPLMAVTNAISSVIIVGALIAAASGSVSVDQSAHATPTISGSSSALSNPPSTLQPGTVADTYDAVPELRSAAPPVRAPEDIAPAQTPWARWLGLLAVVLASVNIFGGFAVTQRMLAMYKKKERR